MTAWLPIGLVLIVVLSGGSSAYPVSSGARQGTAMGTGPDTLPGSLVSSAASPTVVPLTVSNTSVNLSSEFWGTTVTNEVRMFRGETNAVNGTPTRVLVWPGAMAGEDYDPFTETHYDTYDGTATPALTTEAQFVQMCREIHCTAIMQVPAEIDDPSFAEAVVNYTEVNLSFHPAYWMIGNEPELWEHWEVPWKDWPYDYTNGPDPTQFGDEVVAYVKAIRNVDNTTPILGLPASGCTCGSWTYAQWISGVLKVTGDKIQAVAFHEYPAGWLETGNGTLVDFYGEIQGAASIPVRMAAARAAVQSACPGCNVSVFISELGSALSWYSYGPFAAGFSGSLSIASQMTQAMDLNVTNVDLFATSLATSNSWFDSTGHPRPDYGLYTQIFPHLGTQAFPVNLTGMDHTLYGIDTIAPRDEGRRDLLVVNDNITQSISFSPQFAESSGGSPVEVWSWNGSIHNTKSNSTTWVEPYTPNPVPQAFPGGLPANYTLPPQSMVLFEMYPSGATYVQLAETGVPSNAPWYADVGGDFYTVTDGNLSLLLSPGSYPVSSVPIPLPIYGTEETPSEQLEPFVASPTSVSGTYTNVTIDFATQWKVNITASPGDGGTVAPATNWTNASEPLTLTATPALGYALDRWSGWGPGSYNGSGRSITIVPTGRINETAHFVLGYEVELFEGGLPTGTPWSVTVHGFTTSSSTYTLVVYEPNGRYGFQVQPIKGYRILPQNGSFFVNNGWTSVSVTFVRITPPPLSFPVMFQTSGLPASMSVSITVRGATQTAGPSLPLFQLINGSYGYQVGYVAGYHAEVPEKTFAVHGGPLTIEIPFAPTVYPETWEAQGTRSGMNWSLVLNGTPIPATSAWVKASEPNGSYPYEIEVPANFSATPRSGVLDVDGSSTTFSLVFSLVEFPAWFESAGSTAISPWSVRLGNQTLSIAADRSSFMVANGTYTFDVHAPSGYYPVPSHGNLTVAGMPPAIVIQFYPTSLAPSAALVASLSLGALSVSVWIGAAAAVAFVGLRRLRRRGGARR